MPAGPGAILWSSSPSSTPHHHTRVIPTQTSVSSFDSFHHHLHTPRSEPPRSGRRLHHTSLSDHFDIFTSSSLGMHTLFRPLVGAGLVSVGGPEGHGRQEPETAFVSFLPSGLRGGNKVIRSLRQATWFGFEHAWSSSIGACAERSDVVPGINSQNGRREDCPRSTNIQSRDRCK